MGRESGGKSSLRRARKEDGATDEITEGAPIAWRRFRAHVGQGCAEAAVNTSVPFYMDGTMRPASIHPPGLSLFWSFAVNGLFSIIGCSSAAQKTAVELSVHLRFKVDGSADRSIRG
jgi:hypothetical protein